MSPDDTAIILRSWCNALLICVRSCWCDKSTSLPVVEKDSRPIRYIRKSLIVKNDYVTALSTDYTVCFIVILEHTPPSTY
jgi:hypothetical protein